METSPGNMQPYPNSVCLSSGLIQTLGLLLLTLICSPVLVLLLSVSKAAKLPKATILSNTIVILLDINSRYFKVMVVKWLF